MDAQSIEYKMRDINFVKLTDDIFLFKKGWEVWNAATNESKTFGSLKDALGYSPEGDSRTIREMIEALATEAIALDGGRGASSAGNKTFKFNHARDRGGDGVGRTDFPARINVRNSVKTFENAIKTFRDIVAGESSIEHGITVEGMGFATQYRHGGAHSVSIVGRRNEVVVHNHPGNGSFSDSDLYSMAQTPALGIVATYNKGYRIITKMSSFSPSRFVKAVRNARPQGKNYDDAVDKWLVRNQKKLGYRFRNVRD